MLFTLWLAAIGVVPHDLALAFCIDSVLTYLVLKTCWGCARCRGRQSDSPPQSGGWPSEEAHGGAKEGEVESVLPKLRPSLKTEATIRGAEPPMGSRKESPSPSVRRRPRVVDSPQVKPSQPGKIFPRIGRHQAILEEVQNGEKGNPRRGPGVCSSRASAAGTIVLEGSAALNPPMGMEEWAGKVVRSDSKI